VSPLTTRNRNDLSRGYLHKPGADIEAGDSKGERQWRSGT
jgi:hypothetical protein